jgi:sugar phosphate isomerase/epimerase
LEFAKLNQTALPSSFPLGYCTNVHAGSTLAAAKANLERYAVAVRSQLGCDGMLPVGLWLSEAAASELLNESVLFNFRDWLATHQLLPYTFNGFPQGDFHQEVVKHRVYEPTWTCHSRAAYSMTLAQILDVLLPKGANGSISTLPISWPHSPWHAEDFHTAADNLIEVAKYLDHLAQHNGREIVLAIEPEPGCLLNTADEIVEFFQHYLFSGPDAGLARRYLSVCHDICHSSVMFEKQTDALQLYRQNGIRIGKVQISSAVHVPWDEANGNPASQAAMLEQLKAFNEPRYLHQTSVSRPDGRFDKLADDLSTALGHWIPVVGYPSTSWRVHFHVPIFVDSFGQLRTTQSDITEAIQYLTAHGSEEMHGTSWFTGHYEVETYAWPVLPSELRQSDLAAGIAQELKHASELLSK